MSSYKREIIAGAVFLIITSLWLVDAGMNVAGSQSLPLLSLSAQTNSVIGWFATITAIGAIVGELWFIAQTPKTSSKVFERYTIHATIPSYFFFALSPVIMGLVVLFTGQTNWGIGITCLSVPSILIFLALALRKNEQSK